MAPELPNQLVRLMDIHDPFGEERKKSPGEHVNQLATELVTIVKSVGGPNLNPDAVATLMVDIRSWWTSLG